MEVQHLCSTRMNTLTSQPAIIIDGLSLSVTSDNLREMLTPYGTVLWARVVTDSFRRSLSFGYAVMEAEGDVARVIEALNAKTLAGQTIRVSRTAVPPLPRVL